MFASESNGAEVKVLHWKDPSTILHHGSEIKFIIYFTLVQSKVNMFSLFIYFSNNHTSVKVVY